ncbi:MAG: hypothetical protein IAI50_20000, partial [Candidatus Eremiobacteraeota bacterium]|nr:hypothetical protein [Candidatus Eremiobacteraeota bacterium]
PTATPTPAPTPTPTPTAVAVSGAQAAAILTLGGDTYAFVPGTIASPAADAETVGLAEVLIAHGNTLVTSRVAPRGHYAHHQLNHQLPQRRAAPSAGFSRIAGVRRFDTGAGGSQILPLSPSPQECAADVPNTDLYCINYSSNIVNVVHVDPSTKAMTLVTTYTSDASGSIGFSGGSATIVGLTFDPTDKGILIATPTGYELYSSARSATPNVKIKEVATINPAENFGYNPTTNQIWSPSYLTLTGGQLDANLIDVKSGAI